MFLFVFLVFLLAMPGLVSTEEIKKANKELSQEYQLIVIGLKCKSCIPDVRRALKKLSGVKNVRITNFDKRGSTTSVEVEPGVVSEEALILALKSSGFHARIISVGKPREVFLGEEKEFIFLDLFN